MPDLTPSVIIARIHAVHDTSADKAEEGALLTRVNRHMAAITACEEALRWEFSADELSRLRDLLDDMVGPHEEEDLEVSAWDCF